MPLVVRDKLEQLVKDRKLSPGSKLPVETDEELRLARNPLEVNFGVSEIIQSMGLVAGTAESKIVLVLAPPVCSPWRNRASGVPPQKEKGGIFWLDKTLILIKGGDTAEDQI